MKKELMVFLVLLGTSVFSFAQDGTKVINKTQKQQQNRIGEGAKSGELNAKEIKRLEKEQKEIRQDKKMAKSDGVVTKAERKHIKNEQRKASKHIRKSKHDEEVKK